MKKDREILGWQSLIIICEIWWICQHRKINENVCILKAGSKCWIEEPNRVPDWMTLLINSPGEPNSNASDALVCQGCCKKVQQTEWLRRRGVYHLSSRDCRFEIKISAGCCSLWNQSKKNPSFPLSSCWCFTGDIQHLLPWSYIIHWHSIFRRQFSLGVYLLLFKLTF